jgi:serine/threonine protein phosphatase PrpC
VGLLTIGRFAREAGLTPKALRLYDEQGLLAPAAVDGDSGYRLYDPGQLRRARLIAGLRGIDMPLAEIRRVCDLPPGARAGAVTAYWGRVTAGTAARARRAALLVEQLSGKDQAMQTTITVRHAIGCDTGAVRASNQDAAHADDQVFAVADGGGPGGAGASAAAVEALKTLDVDGSPPAELLARLADKITDIHDYVRSTPTTDPEIRPFTTLTALVRTGNRLALAHIGDTRAYLVRGGDLTQLTQDHTWVQGQLDAGRLSAAEAAAHPQRALLVRALGTGGPDVDADLALRTALPGDRYLLCSDGLSAVIPRTALHATLTAGDPPAPTVEALMALVRAQGAPDNIACVVADFLLA